MSELRDLTLSSLRNVLELQAGIGNLATVVLIAAEALRRAEDMPCRLCGGAGRVMTRDRVQFDGSPGSVPCPDCEDGARERAAECGPQPEDGRPDATL